MRILLNKADETSEGESSLMMGVIYGVLASLFVSLYAIYIKRVLPGMNTLGPYHW